VTSYLSAIPREQLGKLESRSTFGRYVGLEGAGIRFLEHGTHRVVIRRDVIVNDRCLFNRAAGGELLVKHPEWPVRGGMGGRGVCGMLPMGGMATPLVLEDPPSVIAPA
jgi:hypothetical protein